MAIFVATFALSLVLGWFLPDGLNQLAGLTGQDRVPDTSLTRFFCFALLFLIAAAIEVLVWLRAQANDAVERIETTVARGLADGAAEAAQSAVLRALLPTSSSPENASMAARQLNVFGALLASVPPQLFAGLSVLVEDGLNEVDARIGEATGPGLNVNIQRHVEITRRIAEHASTFTQINRRAFRVPGQWTQEWLDLVDELGSRGLSTEYIVLMPRDSLDSQSDEIDGMARYLGERGWALRCCELERVQDTLGGKLPTAANVDVYDGRIAKLQAPPQGEYRGGIQLEMRLVELSRDPELRSFVAAVRQFARAPRATKLTG
jgi:hypothetical protein